VRRNTLAKKATTTEVVDIQAALDEVDVVKRVRTHKIVKRDLRLFGHYTIENRALPRVYDGLKPVQRRILWTLWNLRRHSKSIPVKCATVTGKAMGELHPHGDAAIYDALVKMGWFRYPLVQKHGNFGDSYGLEDDPPAAMRYTETQLEAFGDRFFDDIDVMPLAKSFTDEHEEPLLLPARVPITLINGCSGIAVAIATDIPPHNLREVIDATIYLVENPDCDPVDLLPFIKGPDYGEAALTSPREDVEALYLTGEGKLSYECIYYIEEGKKSNKLIITSKAPGLRLGKLIKETTDLHEKKLLVSPINDEGTMENPTCLTIEFTDFSIIRDRIFPLLKTNQSYRFYALDSENHPHRYNLHGILEEFIEFRRQIEEAVLNREKAAVEKKLGTDEAKLVAINNIDFVVEVMKTSTTIEIALQKLMKKLHIEEWQAEVIVNSQIRSLMKLNSKSVQNRIEGFKERLDEITEDLGQIDVVVIRRLKEMLIYADKRGTQIGSSSLNLSETATETKGYNYLAVDEKGKLDRFEELPLDSKAAWKYVDFIKSADPLVMMTGDNRGQTVSISYLDKFSSGQSKVIGMVPADESKAIVVVAKDGSYVAFDPQSIKKDRFNLFRKLESSLVRAVPLMHPKDELIVLYNDDSATTHTITDLKITRPNVGAKRLRHKAKGREVIDVFVKRPSEFLLTTAGDEVGSGELDEVGSSLFVVGKKNLVVVKGGKRYQCTEDDVLDLFESGKNITTIIPIKRKIRKQK